MNYELFIAKQIVAGKEYKNSISSPIIKIAITAIALGMVVMLIAVSIGTGFQQKIRDKIAGFNGHIQIVNYDANNSAITTAAISKKQDFYPKFKNISGIKNVQMYANVAGVLKTKNSFEGIVLKGVSTDYDFTFFKEYITAGRLPNFKRLRNKEILLSTYIANRLGIQLQDTVQALFYAKNSTQKFKVRKPIVVGLYDTGFENFDKSIVIGDIREVQKINRWTADKIGGFEVLLNDFTQLKEKNDAIYSEIGATLNSVSILENYPAIFEWFTLIDNNVWVIIAIMILIAGINMVTALLVLILERVQLVGILKALGSTNWSIRKIFLYNASYLIVKGLLLGNIIGLILLLVQKYFKIISLNPATYYVSTVPVNLNISMFLLLNIGTLVLCFLMLLVPSYIITKIQPVKAIKFS